MVGKVADEILVNIQVNKSQADREVRNWSTAYNRAMDSVDKKTQQTTEKIRRSSSEIGGHLRTLAGALAAGVSVQAISNLLDKYTQLQNRLKVAGLEGQTLLGVQEKLFDVANRNGTAVNGLGELYARMALSQKELGASNEQLLTVTSGVSAALRVQGLTAEQAAGPLLQLGQAFGAGIVRAEEFNSLIEGMPTLVQAAAKHIDGANGSISQLRNLMLEGKVTSQAFFQALLKGLPEVERTAQSASLTIGQAMTTLNNELIKYAGQVDASLSVSERFVGMINLLSGNLDKIAPAIGVIATILGGRFLAGLVGSAAATFAQAAAFERAGGAALVASARYDRMTASTARMATASEIAAVQAAFAAGQMTKLQLAAATTGNVMSSAGSKILSVFGGPVGLAVTGLTAAFAGLAMEAYQTSADIGVLNTAVTSSDDLIAKFQPKADGAKTAVQQIGDEANIAAPKITAFAGEVGKAAQALWDLAKAKQAAALAELNNQRTQLSQSTSNVQQNLPENIGIRQNNRNITSLKDVFEPFGARVVQIAKDAWTGGEYTTNNRAKVAEGMAGLARLDAEIARVGADLEQFANADPASAPAAAGGGKKTKSGDAAARRAAADAKREREELVRRQRMMEDDLFRMGDALLSAMMERDLTAQERLELDLKALDRDREANKRAIDRDVIDGEKTEAQANMLKELEDGVYNERVANRTRQGQEDIRQEALNAEQAMLDLQLELLGLKSQDARTAEESRKIQLEILRLQQERARKELDANIAADPTLDGPALRAKLTEVEKAQTAGVIKQTMDPLEQWLDASLDAAGEVKQAYQQVAADGLDRISSSFVDMITGAKSAKEAFAEMAMSILADIAKIEARQLVSNLFKAVMATAGGGSPTPIPGLSGGGMVGGRGTGRSDSNLVRLSRGEFVVKERQTSKYKAMLEAINNDTLPGYANGGIVGRMGSAGAIPGSSSAKLIQQFFIDAKGSVLADELLDQMQSISAVQASQAGFASVNYQQSKQQRSALRNSKRFV